MKWHSEIYKYINVFKIDKFLEGPTGLRTTVSALMWKRRIQAIQKPLLLISMHNVMLIILYVTYDS